MAGLYHYSPYHGETLESRVRIGRGIEHDHSSNSLRNDVGDSQLCNCETADWAKSLISCSVVAIQSSS